jgi:tetratricopeptide (TPR) repeat protein
MSPQKRAQEHLNKGDKLAWGPKAKPDAALEQYRFALQLDPALAAAYWRIGQLHFFAEQPRLNEALQAFQDTIRVEPDWAEGHLWFANVLSDLDQDAQAVLEYQIAMRLSPTDSRAPISLASCLVKLNRFPEAILAYQAGIALNPAYCEMAARMMLADALKKDNQIQVAVHQWKIVAGMKSVWDYEKGEPEKAAQLVAEYSIAEYSI